MEDVFNLLLLFLAGVLYIYTFTKIQQRYFNQFGLANRPIAASILLMASVLGATINLIHISEIAANANRFFLRSGDYSMPLIYTLSFFTGMWVYSLILFHITFLITGRLTIEEEKVELEKNNIELSLLHSVILIGLSFVTAPQLIIIASKFIPYPDLPFSN
jgi:hypothetical protein